MKNLEILRKISSLDFTGKGESFVEQRFLTPLLECLGYENHKDYEVHRHGDAEINFKLNYPPVETGAKKVKHYHPDYVPTIRKKIFWIIEAKSPMTISSPFSYEYIVQGLQYCIHPEIQSKYLILSNGIDTSIYDAQSALYLNENMYEAIFSFNQSEIVDKWSDIYNLLGVEKIRLKIEMDLKMYYEKLCLSSLDDNYPHQLAQTITENKTNLSIKIKKHLNTLIVEDIDNSFKTQENDLKNKTLDELKDIIKIASIQRPIFYIHYIDMLISEYNEDKIISLLTTNYKKMSYFEKEHCFASLATFYNTISNQALKDDMITFFKEHVNEEISLLNKLEALHLRLYRKSNVISVYPEKRKEINEYLKTAPELERFVNKPNALIQTYSTELLVHHNFFELIVNQTDIELIEFIKLYEEIEKSTEKLYKEAESKLNENERELGGGFAYFGVGNKIWSLPNILKDYNIEIF